ncbi:ATP-dependent sacrificial sulfur transferase LarE [Desulfovibrio sp.]|uniref:ATP-dependent sacrificial sulfur transferase LarE n=1 Tax=Desulfovibrio sp. TaxID=885 RepID=UPI00261540AE|nr:ATP-dependent sacrificial sulfur transferase LarE [Desulfovibrio sp.]
MASEARLREALAGLPRVAVALSGGIDSRFLCHMALACGCDVAALHASGPHVPPEESAAAREWAQVRGLRFISFVHDPLSLPEVAANSRERCYACKRALLGGMRAVLEAAGEEGRVLCDGGNADDQRAFRPGLRAVAEAGVRSPLAEAGLAKSAIRELARATGLDRPDQPSRPCLLTRLAYGMEPTASLLARVAATEAALAALDAADREATGPEGGFGEFRLRLAPEPVLQCGRFPERLAAAAQASLAQHGFAPFSVVTGGEVSGFFDAGPR